MRLDSAYIEDIRLAAEDIADFVSGLTLQEFLSDAKTRFAVERQLITMGEAATRISDEFKARHAHIPWARIVHLRNFYVHAYERLTPEEVWGTATKLVPRVGRMVTPLVPNDDAETE